MNIQTSEIKTKLIDLRIFIDVNELYISYKLDNIDYNLYNQTFTNIQEIAKLSSFDNLVKINFDDYNMDDDTDAFISLPDDYNDNKNDYEKYFKTKINVNEMDYYYALLIKIGYSNMYDTFEELSKHFPNIFTKGVYNALCVFDADDIIYQDKIDKGIVVVHEKIKY